MRRFDLACDRAIIENFDLTKVMNRDKRANAAVLKLREQLAAFELFRRNAYKHEAKYYLKSKKRLKKDGIQDDMRKKVEQLNRSNSNNKYYLFLEVGTVSRPQNKHEYFIVTPFIIEFERLTALELLDESRYERFNLSPVLHEKLLRKTLEFLKSQTIKRKRDRRCEEQEYDDALIACLEKNFETWVLELYSSRFLDKARETLKSKGARGMVDVGRHIEETKTFWTDAEIDEVAESFVRANLSSDSRILV